MNLCQGSSMTLLSLCYNPDPACIMDFIMLHVMWFFAEWRIMETRTTAREENDRNRHQDLWHWKCREKLKMTFCYLQSVLYQSNWSSLLLLMMCFVTWLLTVGSIWNGMGHALYFALFKKKSFEWLEAYANISLLKYS